MKLTSNFKILFTNFTYLSVLQGLNMLFPLLTYPYLIRLFGSSVYGSYVFCNAIMTYVIMMINFGFNISATKKISENRFDICELSKIVSSILYLKLIIFVSTFILVILFFISFDFGRVDIRLFLALIGLCIQEIFFPLFFFQGIEKMKYITLVNFCARLFYVITVFLIIRQPNQILTLAILNSSSCILASFFSIYLIYHFFELKLVRVEFNRLKSDFLESVPFFFSRLSSVIVERSNVFIVGAFFDYSLVAIYDLCAKVVNLCSIPFALVAQVVYPNVAKTKNMVLIRSCYKYLVLIGLILSFIVLLFADNIVLLLGGKQMIESADWLRIMIFYVPFTAVSSILGASTLVVNGFSKQYNLSNVLSLIVFILLISIAYLLNSINFVTIAIAFVAPEMTIALYRRYITYKYNLI